MNPFLANFDKLRDDFHSHSIPTTDPGFCDHEAFLRIEQSQSPEYLNNYAAFVARQHYDDDYLIRAAQTIESLAGLLHAELVNHSRLGACVDIAGILGRMLEREGIWNCLIKGSLTVDFPKGTGLDTEYFWSVDEGDFVAGHSWVYAPPFTVVDISVKQQRFADAKREYVPDMIISRDTTLVDVDANDYLSPLVRHTMNAQGIPEARHLQMGVQFVPAIVSCFPAIQEVGPGGSQLKYAPAAIHAPDGTFEIMTNMTFDGLTPFELYTTKIRPAIERNA